MRKFAASHDLSLPDWGPYSKKYFGISHLPDKKRGIRFDISLLPGIYRRRKVCVPDVLTDSGYCPWESSANLDYYSYRQQIEWKDNVYCDVSFSRLHDDLRMMRCQCVNNTDQPISLSLHLLSFLAPGKPNDIVPDIPKEAIWLNAPDCCTVIPHIIYPQSNLGFAGYRRGEIPDSQAVGGTCIGANYSGNPVNVADTGLQNGDCLELALPESSGRIKLLLRYRTRHNGKNQIILSGVIEQNVLLRESEDYILSEIYTGITPAGKLEIKFEGKSEVFVDGFILCPANDYNDIKFKDHVYDTEPQISAGPVNNSLLLAFKEIDCHYGLWCSNGNSLARRFSVENWAQTFKYSGAIPHKYVDCFDRGGRDKCTELMIQPVKLDSRSEDIVYFYLCTGSESEIKKILKSLDTSVVAMEKIYRYNRARRIKFKCIPEGRGYLFSMERMAAVITTNVVYPIHVKRRYIKHSTPGKCFDSLYTWDSGFIGLGLLELDTKRAVETLNAYLTAPDDEESAFIHFGTPLPVQHYLFLEIWNRTQDIEFLRSFYPSLKKYYDFLAGHAKSSTTSRLKSNLLQTLDYFYNSGGWDDYPPQLYCHKNNKFNVAPAVTTSHVIRVARILSMAAIKLDLQNDIKLYRQDIRFLTEALQSNSWDSQSGYFSYAEHDDSGQVVGFMKHEPSGTNYNMGLDGMSPLVAGICTEEQKDIFLNRLQSGRYWTANGLSTVDRHAPYFNHDGYWNGSIWMPHQWFFWKSALNEGWGDFAWKIARTALELWKRETEDSYCCFEHFTVSDGRGCGWHHFSGLSSPVLSWFAAYFCVGRISSGYDVWISDYRFDAGNSKLEADIIIYGDSGDLITIIIVTGKSNMKAKYNDISYECKERLPGVWEVTLPKNSRGFLTLCSQ